MRPAVSVHVTISGVRSDRAAAVEPDPDAGDDLGREADEPRIGRVIGRAGLPRDWPVIACARHRGTSAVGNRVRHELGRDECDPCIHDMVAARRRRAPQHGAE